VIQSFFLICIDFELGIIEDLELHMSSLSLSVADFAYCIRKSNLFMLHPQSLTTTPGSGTVLQNAPLLWISQLVLIPIPYSALSFPYPYPARL
jgi:hypothetical protein